MLIAAAVVLILGAAVIQFAGFSAGAFQEEAPRRVGLGFGVPAITCGLIGIALFFSKAA